MTRIIFLLSSFLLVACQIDPRSVAPEVVKWKQPNQVTNQNGAQKPLEFIVAPWLAKADLVRLYTPLLENLSAQLGERVRLNIAPDYPTLIGLIERNKIDIAQVNARTFQRLMEKGRPHRYVGTVAHLTSSGKLRLGSQGLLFALRTMTLSQSEVKGLRLGLIDKRSTSGYLLPKLWLERRGVTLTDFKDVLLLGSHTRAFTALIDDRVDVIASWDGQKTLEQGRLPKTLLSIAETGALPNDAWVVVGPQQEALHSKLSRWAETLPAPSDPSELYTMPSAFGGLRGIATETYQALPKLED